MGKLYSLISALLLTVSATFAAAPDSYEWWFDHDVSATQTGSIAGSTLNLEIDMSSIPQGTHYFNCRLGYGDGNWGSVYRKMILNLTGVINAMAYEYWIDDNYSTKTSGVLSSGVNSYDIDLTGVNPGFHRFNYRIMTGEGVWSTPFIRYFYSESNASRFTHYEYWLDNDYANRVTGNATGNPTSFEVDLSAFDKSGGAHYFNLRTRDGDGDWSPIYHKLLVFDKTEKRQPIIGYRHFLNGTDFGYVEVEHQFVDNYTFDVNIPDSVHPSIRNLSPSFDGDRVYLAAHDSIDYTMQVRTEFGWAAPQKWKLGISNNFSTTAIAMEINSKHTFSVPSALEFKAIKFTSLGDSLYFRSDIPIALDIYREEEKLVALTSSQVKGMAMLKLEAGEYFGVLHSVEDMEVQNFTLHLMDTPNQVPMPIIAYEDETVTISCTREDVVIRYTLDSKEPNEESTVYSEPFPLKRNTTIKAKAWVEGSDIEPSAIAEYIIDSYKVSTPYGRFDSASRMLTIECATEVAKIFHAFSQDTDEWIEYSTPISITNNCTVYAKATRDGWNDSDMATIEVSEMQCAGVSTDYHGHYVSLKTAESGASILYTTDGTEPSDGIKYEGEFDAEGICTIRAIAVKERYMNSEETQLKIDYYSDEEHAETTTEGLLASAFEWDSELPTKVTDFRIEGRLNADDYAFIRSMSELRHLDLEDVADAHIPDNAFRDSRLISISLPADMAECGDSILSGAPLLSSVVWNSESMNVGEDLTHGFENPNVLLYVPASTDVPDSSDLNIVRQGIASEITLHYGHPYYVARNIHANRVSLTHDFTQTTAIDTCRGWETIVLPFSPTEYTHEVNGPALPFASWEGQEDSRKPFWLYQATSDGWEAARDIKACVPYIISMPENPDYVKEFNLGGKVTFSANNVNLGPESSLASSDYWVDGMTFEGTFMPMEGVHTLNVNSTEGGLEPGSKFVPDSTTLPFGAYVSGAPARKVIPLFGESSSVDMPMIVDAGLLIETPAPGILRICSGRERRVAVVTATGVTIRMLHLKPGEAQTLEGLTRDLYIVAGRKVMVR
ncbi:MAG: chitobiase/beta-hexosaminidase C-terminal domain-containing protein [Muribaculaceae bacterium]|nr:chitobiase/beta-hexosaminidase C-terminal domain-containing protein [Muribaculaceae bacterium]